MSPKKRSAPPRTDSAEQPQRKNPAKKAAASPESPEGAASAAPSQPRPRAARKASSAPRASRKTSKAGAAPETPEKAPAAPSAPRSRKRTAAAARTTGPEAGSGASQADAQVPAAAQSETTPARRDAPARGPQSEPSKRRLRVLFVTSEAHPFAKTGGLAEVGAALPAALTRLGHEVTLVIPRYRSVDATGTAIRTFGFSLGSLAVKGQFLERRLPDGVHAVFVDVPHLYDRAALYGEGGRDYPDNALRFAVFARAALEYARLRGERPDIIHTHDWQAGLVPVYQKMQFSDDPVVGGVPVVFTIHNLAFQGVFPAQTLDGIGLGWNVFHHDALEYWGNISFLKGGLNFSEKITTVSPTYAREILTPSYGFGLEGALRRRADDLVGIVNGIDTDRWDPGADTYLPVTYSADSLEQKREAKKALLQNAGLPDDEASLRRPVIGMISRLTDQKGFDLIGAAAGDLMALDASWVLLGSGERHYEDLLRRLAERHPDRVSTTIGFDERLAHLIEGGADMFLMPSRFEPCGLNQLYSLRYGTVPIVRATGGLDDTVVDADQPGGNGIKFAEYTTRALVEAVHRGLELYRDADRWAALQRAGMAVDPSWDVSAREYVKVYEDLQQR